MSEYWPSDRDKEFEEYTPPSIDRGYERVFESMRRVVDDADTNLKDDSDSIHEVYAKLQKVFKKKLDEQIVGLSSKLVISAVAYTPVIQNEESSTESNLSTDEPLEPEFCYEPVELHNHSVELLDINVDSNPDSSTMRPLLEVYCAETETVYFITIDEISRLQPERPTFDEAEYILKNYYLEAYSAIRYGQSPFSQDMHTPAGKMPPELSKDIDYIDHYMHVDICTDTGKTQQLIEAASAYIEKISNIDYTQPYVFNLSDSIVVEKGDDINIIDLPEGCTNQIEGYIDRIDFSITNNNGIAMLIPYFRVIVYDNTNDESYFVQLDFGSISSISLCSGVNKIVKNGVDELKRYSSNYESRDDEFEREFNEVLLEFLKKHELTAFTSRSMASTLAVEDDAFNNTNNDETLRIISTTLEDHAGANGFIEYLYKRVMSTKRLLSTTRDDAYVSENSHKERRLLQDKIKELELSDGDKWLRVVKEFYPESNGTHSPDTNEVNDSSDKIHNIITNTLCVPIDDERRIAMYQNIYSVMDSTFNSQNGTSDNELNKRAYAAYEDLSSWYQISVKEACDIYDAIRSNLKTN